MNILFQIYEIVQFSHVGTTRTLFWRDERRPEGVGPFPSQFEAMKSYEASLRGTHYTNSLYSDGTQGSVIHVNFTTKKRI